MASSFASNSYRGQSQFLPAGYMEAATAPGRSIAAGIQQAGAAIGEGLSDAISGYAKRKEEDAMLQAKLEAKGALAISPEGGDLHNYIFSENADKRAVDLFTDIEKVMEDPGSMKRDKKYALAAKLDAYMDLSNAARQRELQRKENRRAELKEKRDAELHQSNMIRNAYATSAAVLDEKRRMDAENAANRVDDINALIAMGKTPTTKTEDTRNVVSAPMTPEQEQQLIATGGVPYAPDSQVFRYTQQQINANDPFAQYDIRNFPDRPQAQPVPQAQAVSQSRPGEKDPEFYKQTLARLLDSVATDVGDSAYNYIPSEYRVGSGFEYRTREPGDIPDGLADYVPTGRKMRGKPITKKVPNFNRIEAFIQQLKANGVNTPELRQLEYLTNLRTPAGQAPPRQVEDYREAVPSTSAAPTPVMSTPTPVDRPMMPKIVQGTREVPLTATERDAALVEMANRTPGFSELPPRDRYTILKQQRQLRASGPVIYNAGDRQFIKQPNGSFSELSERGDKVSRPTEAQAKALQFASELSYVNEELEKIQRNYNPEGWIASFARSLPTFLQGDTTKAYSNMADKWIEAALRDRSGAAIAAHEYDGARSQFFPVIGDSPENIERKRRLRDVATQAMIQRARGIPVDQIDFSFRRKENGEEYETKAAVKTQEVRLSDGRPAIIEPEN